MLAHVRTHKHAQFAVQGITSRLQLVDLIRVCGICPCSQLVQLQLQLMQFVACCHEPSEQLPRQCSVAESFFNLPERERIRRRVYKTCTDAQQDVFDYLEMFYNPKRKHVRNGMLSRVEFERQQAMRSTTCWVRRRQLTTSIPVLC
jgi:uridine kinase